MKKVKKVKKVKMSAVISVISVISVLLLLSVLLSAISCDGSDKTQKSNINLDNLSMKLNVGVVNTTIENVGDLTSFKTREQVDSFVTAPLTAIHDDKVYLLRNFPAEFEDFNELYEYINSGLFSSEIEVYSIENMTEPSDIISLSGIGSNRIIYGNLNYNSSDNTLIVTGRESVDGQFASYVYTFSLSGELISKNETVLDTTFDVYDVSDSGIYKLVNSSEKNAVSTDLVCVDVESGISQIIAQSTAQFCVADDNVYYIHNYYTDTYEIKTELCVYRMGNTETLFELNGWSEFVHDLEEGVEGIAFDAVNNILYFSHSGYIYAYYNGKFGTVITTFDANANVVELSGSNLLVKVGYNQLSLYDISEIPTFVEEKLNVLKICCVHSDENAYTSFYEPVLQLMNINGLQVKFDYTYITASNDEYDSVMAKKLLAGDDDFDIFVIDSSLSGLFSENYLFDLSKYDVLTPYYDSMIDGLAELCTVGKKRALVPTHLSTDVITTTDGFGSADMLLDDIFKLDTDSQLLFGNKDNISLLMPWFRQLTSNYMASAIDDSEAEVGLETLFAYALNLSDYSNVYIGEDYSNKKYTLDFYINASGAVYGCTQPVVYPLSKIAANYKNIINCSFLALNPKSQNKDLAAAFFAYYMEASKLNIVLDQAFYYEDSTADKMPGYDVFKGQIADSVRAYDFPEVYSYLIEQKALLDKSEIDLNKAVNNTLHFLKMIRDE